jgi:hypothetical protein
VRRVSGEITDSFRATPHGLPSTSSYLRQALLVGESVHESGSIFDAEPQIYSVEMSFDCAFAYPQLARNYFIWVASADKRYDLSLAFRQITRTLKDSFPTRPTEVRGDAAY